jgi:hypothetical protein
MGTLNGCAGVGYGLLVMRQLFQDYTLIQAITQKGRALYHPDNVINYYFKILKLNFLIFKPKFTFQPFEMFY